VTSPASGPGSAGLRGRVLKAGDVAAVRRSDEQVRRERDAERLAAVRAEAARQDAVAAAYAAGLDAGRARALAEGADAAPRVAAALERLADVTAAQHAAQVGASSRAVLSAALDIAAWVLRAEVAADSRALLARLEDSAGALLPGSGTRVRVAPADADAVRAWAARRPALEVVADTTLQPGDAAVETDSGSVDVSVAAALRVAAETLGV
jgi:flagellar assembly protein FliH